MISQLSSNPTEADIAQALLVKEARKDNFHFLKVMKVLRDWSISSNVDEFLSFQKSPYEIFLAQKLLEMKEIK